MVDWAAWGASRPGMWRSAGVVGRVPSPSRGRASGAAQSHSHVTHPHTDPTHPGTLPWGHRREEHSGALEGAGVPGAAAQQHGSQGGSLEPMADTGGRHEGGRVSRDSSARLVSGGGLLGMGIVCMPVGAAGAQVVSHGAPTCASAQTPSHALTPRGL